MTSYLYRAPAGIPGEITRPDETAVEPGYLSSTGTPIAFGLALKTISSANIVKFQTLGTGGIADTAALFYGILSRIAPSVSPPQGSDSYNGTLPNVLTPQGIVTRGYVNVLCPTGTPVRGALVYVVVVAYAGQPVGSFTAVANGTNTIQLTNVTWASDGKDAQNNAEVRVAR